MPMLLTVYAGLSIAVSRSLFAGYFGSSSVCGGLVQYIDLTPGFLISSVLLLVLLTFLNFSRWKVALLLAVMIFGLHITSSDNTVDLGDFAETFKFAHEHCVNYAFIWHFMNWCGTLIIFDILRIWKSRRVNEN